MRTELIIFLFFLLVRVSTLPAAAITTNNVTIPNPPSWLKESRVEKVIAQIEGTLEWDIRRVKVSFVNDEKAFEDLHHYGPTVEAFFRRSDSSVFLGPQVTSDKFDGIFGHELAHVIVFQKYHDAIPSWLEEGLANYVAKKGKVDYKWLATQKLVPVRTLEHPYHSSLEPRFHYMASTAIVEMIAAKCSLTDLLQLSVGKKLETYLGTYCEIADLDSEFKKWVQSKRVS